LKFSKRQIIVYVGKLSECHQVISFFQTCAFRHSHPLLLQADEVTPPLDTAERATDGINLIMARLMNILDSWISFEDNVMEELDASEHAAQNVMRGIVGEVDLVDRTSAAITGSLVDNVIPRFPNLHIVVTSIQRLYTP
jgi:hypothetical protein